MRFPVNGCQIETNAHTYFTDAEPFVARVVDMAVAIVAKPYQELIDNYKRYVGLLPEVTCEVANELRSNPRVVQELSAVDMKELKGVEGIQRDITAGV